MKKRTLITTGKGHQQTSYLMDGGIPTDNSLKQVGARKLSRTMITFCTSKKNNTTTDEPGLSALASRTPEVQLTMLRLMDETELEPSTAPG